MDKNKEIDKLKILYDLTKNEKLKKSIKEKIDKLEGNEIILK